MGVFDKVIKVISDSIKTDEKIKQISEQIKTLSHEVRDMNNRLIKIETIIEITKEASTLKKLNKK